MGNLVHYWELPIGANFLEGNSKSIQILVKIYPKFKSTKPLAQQCHAYKFVLQIHTHKCKQLYVYQDNFWRHQYL